MYVFYEPPDVNVRYFVRILAYDFSIVGDEVSVIPDQKSVTATQGDLAITSISTTVDGRTSSSVEYDSHTITLAMTVEGSGDGFTGQTYMWLDIRTAVDDKSIFANSAKQPIELTIVFSSISFSATATYLWDACCYDHGAGQHKHNGTYNMFIYPTKDSSDDEILESQVATVDVVHVNIGEGIEYRQVGSDSEADQIHYGPPFIFDYYLSKSAFVTWKIWDRNQTPTLTDDTLVKVVVSSAARVKSDSSADPDAWDTNVHREVWDGRNDKGAIVTNDIYRYTFYAIEYWEESGSGFDAATTDRTEYEGTIAFDVLRLMNLASAGITDSNALAHITYTLGGANTEMGGANIKIVICSPGTTFYMAASEGSMSYLNGSATYYYKIGDPLPMQSASIKKIFSFDRSAGDQDETWNGYDDAGAALANNNYVFAISATDDSGNHAIDNSGNDRIIIGNITIDRTAAQEAGDSDPPTVTSISAGTSNSLTGIELTGTPTQLSLPFTTIAVTLTDSGGSGVDLANTSISITAPNGASIAQTAKTNNSVDTITITVAQQSTNGTYSVRVTPRDTSGNTASETIYTFTLSVTQEGVEEAFEDSVYVYPNPAKGLNSVNFVYDISTPTAMKLEIFNLLGELIYKDEWTPTTIGQQFRTWNIVNDSNTKIATGVYLYRITAEGISTSKKLKKVVVVQ
jgi:flagellar hook assembly protein FlgD